MAVVFSYLSLRFLNPWEMLFHHPLWENKVQSMNMLLESKPGIFIS